MNDDIIRRSDAIEVAYQLRRKSIDEEWDWWLRSFNAIPPIDIVFCRECKYASDNKVYGCMLNRFNNDGYHRMFADDFCSYGERREP